MVLRHQDNIGGQLSDTDWQSICPGRPPAWAFFISADPPVALALSFDRVLDAANRVLHLTLSLIRRALSFELLIASCLACGFLDLAAHIGGGALHTIFVHDTLLGAQRASGGTDAHG